MKKLILICILLLMFFLVYDFQKIDQRKSSIKKKEVRAMFISYIELSRYINGFSSNEIDNNIKMITKNIKKLGFNTIILQVRSFSDAIYKSDIYPWSSVISGSEGVNPGIDVLERFIYYSHNNDIELHAWINPYRVRLNNNISSITLANPAYKFINTDNLYIIDNGIFYNPVKDEVIDLIKAGVVELLNNYKVDGIHFDDYFYPDTEVGYENYINEMGNNSSISFNQYRLNKVNTLIKGVYKICHNKGVLFGISPSGSINNNYDYLFADVKKWGSSKGYVDYLMPQIYYGFFNSSQDFYNTLQEWDKLIKIDSIKLIPALAFYKVGLVDKYAKDGEFEWVNNDDIIKKEIIVSRGVKNYGGFAIYRYDYLFNKDLMTKTTMMEKKNMLEIIK